MYLCMYVCMYVYIYIYIYICIDSFIYSCVVAAPWDAVLRCPALHGRAARLDCRRYRYLEPSHSHLSSSMILPLHTATINVPPCSFRLRQDSDNSHRWRGKSLLRLPFAATITILVPCQPFQYYIILCDAVQCYTKWCHTIPNIIVTIST